MTARPWRRIGLAVAAGLALVAAGLLPALVGSRVTDRELAEVLSARAGGTVTWRGEPQVTVFPRLQFTLADVTFLQGFDGGGRPLAAIPRLEISFRTLPLLWGRVEAAVLALDEPRIHVAADPTSPAAWHAGRSGMSALLGADLVDAPTTVVVRDGEITYREPRTGRVETINAVDVRSSWDPEAGVVRVSGRVEHEGRALTLDAALNDPWEVFGAEGARGRVSVASDHLAPLLVDGRFALTRDRDGLAGLRIADASFRSAAVTARGNLTVSRGEPRPRLEGALAFDEVALTPVLERWLPDTLAELMAMPVSSRWLGLADVDLRVTADGADVGGLWVADPVVRLGLEDGFLNLHLLDAGVAGGRIDGVLSATPDGAGIRATASGRVTGLSLLEAGEPLRPAPTALLIGSEQPPSGRAVAAFDVAVHGERVAELGQSLAGWLALDIRDGSVDGADTIATLERLVDSNAAIAEGEAPFIPAAGRTHFSALTAWATASEGELRLQQLNLAGEGFEIGLAGRVDLGNGEIDARGTARLYDDAERLLVALPFGVGGTWRHPMAAPGIPHRPVPLLTATLAAPVSPAAPPLSVGEWPGAG